MPATVATVGSCPVNAVYRPTDGHVAARVAQAQPAIPMDIWWVIRRNPGKIAIATLLGIALGAVYTLAQPRIYQAAATVEIRKLNGNLLGLKDMQPAAEQNAATPNDVQTQVRILESGTMIERVLEKLPPEQEPPATGARRFFASILRRGKQPRTREEKLEHVRANLQVRDSRQSDVLDIYYDSPDPEYAARFVNTLAQQYIAGNLEERWATSQETGEWMSRQIDEIRRKLTESENRLQDYARHSGLLFTAEKQNPSDDKLRQVQEALSKAQEDRMAKQAWVEALSGATPDSLPAEANNSSLRDYQNKLTDLRRQRAELSTVFKPDFDGIKRLDAQILTLEAALKSEQSAVRQRIRKEYESAVRRENLLEASFLRQTQVVARDSEKAVQYGILRREVDSNRQLYELMLQRSKEAAVASAMRASNVRIIDPAQRPERPYKPNALQNTMWGLMGGVFCGVVLVVALDRFDRKVRRPGELRSSLNIPELGWVSSVKHTRPGSVGVLRRARPVDAGGIQVEAEGSAPLDSKRQAECVELASWQDRSSRTAESFRRILASILFSNGNGGMPQMIVVTSALAGEGKTTVTSNLAAALGRVGRTVLVVDADLSRPRLHRLFNASREIGFGDLLDMDTKEDADLLACAIQETDIPGVFYFGSGRLTENAADLLYSDRMAALLRRALDRFDMILIDSPPVLESPDARILGRIADGVVLVVHAGTASLDDIAAVRERFQEEGIHLLGTVLNQWVA